MTLEAGMLQISEANEHLRCNIKKRSTFKQLYRPYHQYRKLSYIFDGAVTLRKPNKEQNVGKNCKHLYISLHLQNIFNRKIITIWNLS